MREGSHDICAVGQTGQLLPATVAWIDALETRLRDDSLDGLTSLEIAENVAATERACHLELEPGTDAQRFATIASEAVTGMSAQVLDSRAIVTLAGRPSISDSLGSLVLTRDVRAFFQGNRFLLESFVQHVTTLVADGPVVDLYAGVGLFGLALAARGRSEVTLVEGDPISGHDLEENARRYSGLARVERTSVEDFLRRARPSIGDTFVVDPPRTGLSREAVHSVARLKPRCLIYISCDVATLARDVRVLVDSGYGLAHMSAFDLFPNTAHVETICVLRSDG
jgi:23S rRNA (uracil1939-C5)-methyltransferase